MIKDVIRSQPWLYKPLKPAYEIALRVIDIFRSLLFAIIPNAGIESYRKMQEQQYRNYTKTFDDSKNLCVGVFERHEAYPYETYLLEHFSGKHERALDFACGMGRMMKRMLSHFNVVDGVDLNKNNLDYAVKYLSESGIGSEKYTLHLSNGVGVNGLQQKYDFIYSTIALQHISVYSIRFKIFEDLFCLLKDGGRCCFQMGFAWDNGVHWFDNNFTARSTNAGADVTIPNSDHLDAITKDFELIGFKDIKYELKISPHPEFGNKYHPVWIFMHMKK